MAQPIILNYESTDNIRAPITSTQTIEAGDLAKISASGYVYPVDAATNDLTFAGIALDTSTDGDTQQIAISPKCMVEIDVTSAAYTFGVGLLWTSDNTLEDDGGANTLAWVGETQTSAVTRLKVYIDTFKFKKKFENNA